MNPKLQRRIQRYGWDRAVNDYESSWKAQLRPAQDRMLEYADVRPGEHVLDVACGTGLVSLRAAETAGPQGLVLGTDISEKMIENARRSCASIATTNLSFERADAEHLPVPDAAFDVALSALGLMYVPDPAAALREMRRALKPRGRAAVWGARNQCGWAEIFPIVDSRVRSEVCPLFFQLGTGDTLADAFNNAGFGEVAHCRLSTTLYYRSAQHAIEAAFAGGPVALAYSRFDEDTRSEAHAEYLDSLKPYRCGKTYEIPGEYVVAAGRKVA